MAKSSLGGCLSCLFVAGCLLVPGAATAAPTETQLEAALAAVKKDKIVLSAAWNSKTLPSLLIGVNARGKAPGAFDGYARGVCGTLAAHGVGGAFVRIMDNNASGWVELSKVECPAAPKAQSAAHQQPTPAAIQNLAGKDAQTVAGILGRPLSTEKTKRGPKMTYVSARSGVQWEIIYIGGKADWITITPSAARPVPFDQGAITATGLPQSAPAFASPSEIRWENVQGLRSVSIYPDGAKVAYVYVKVSTQ